VTLSVQSSSPRIQRYPPRPHCLSIFHLGKSPPGRRTQQPNGQRIASCDFAGSCLYYKQGFDYPTTGQRSTSLHYIRTPQEKIVKHRHTRRMKSDRWHGVHVWLRDVFNHNRNVEVPSSDRLVIRSRHESPIFVDKCDSVHWSQVLVVFLGDLAVVDIVLTKGLGTPRKESSCHTWIIFLSDIPAKNMFCLSSSGWKRTTYGILPLLNRCKHCPVSVSHNFIKRS
jgi:hypothetical protein